MRKDYRCTWQQAVGQSSGGDRQSPLETCVGLSDGVGSERPSSHLWALEGRPGVAQR